MKKNLVLSGCFFALFLILIALVKTVDVAAVGPENTYIGLAGLNMAAHELFGENMLWYDVTQWLGIAAIGTALVFAAIGFFQIIKRRSLLKVDREILFLGGLFIVTIGLYVFFEHVIINYRPIIMPGAEHPEASFPSSHTMLVYAVFGSAAMLMGKYVKNRGLCIALQVVCVLIIPLTFIGRLLSGVHWLTDIIGGILVSAALLFLFNGLTGAPTRGQNGPKHLKERIK